MSEFAKDLPPHLRAQWDTMDTKTRESMEQLLGSRDMKKRVIVGCAAAVMTTIKGIRENKVNEEQAKDIVFAALNYVWSCSTNSYLEELLATEQNPVVIISAMGATLAVGIPTADKQNERLCNLLNMVK